MFVASARCKLLSQVMCANVRSNHVCVCVCVCLCVCVRTKKLSPMRVMRGSEAVSDTIRRTTTVDSPDPSAFTSRATAYALRVETHTHARTRTHTHTQHESNHSVAERYIQEYCAVDRQDSQAAGMHRPPDNECAKVLWRCKRGRALAIRSGANDSEQRHRVEGRGHTGLWSATLTAATAATGRVFRLCRVRDCTSCGARGRHGTRTCNLTHTHTHTHDVSIIHASSANTGCAWWLGCMAKC